MNYTNFEIVLMYRHGPEEEQRYPKWAFSQRLATLREELVQPACQETEAT